MIHKRESAEDLQKQKRLFQVFANKYGLKFKQISSTSKKYRIDGYCYDDKNNIRAWIECKWYNNTAHCYLNVPKYNELITLSERTGIPSYLLFREYEKWGMICLHNGKEVNKSYETKYSGGTAEGKPENEDDIEPLIVLNKRNIIWGN